MTIHTLALLDVIFSVLTIVMAIGIGAAGGTNQGPTYIFGLPALVFGWWLLLTILL